MFQGRGVKEESAGTHLTPTAGLKIITGRIGSVVLRSQMRGLEAKSVTRRNGRGPDSSLKRFEKYV